LFLVRSIIIGVITNPHGLKNYLEVTDTTTLYILYMCKNYDLVWFMHCPILLKEKTVEDTSCLLV